MYLHTHTLNTVMKHNHFKFATLTENANHHNCTENEINNVVEKYAA